MPICSRLLIHTFCQIILSNSSLVGWMKAFSTRVELEFYWFYFTLDFTVMDWNASLVKYWLIELCIFLIFTILTMIFLSMFQVLLPNPSAISNNPGLGLEELAMLSYWIFFKHFSFNQQSRLNLFWSKFL